MAHARQDIRADIEARIGALPEIQKTFDSLEHNIAEGDYPTAHVWLEVDDVEPSGGTTTDPGDETLSHKLTLRLVISAVTMVELETAIEAVEIEMEKPSATYGAAFFLLTEFGDPLEIGIEVNSATLGYQVDYTNTRRVPGTLLP